MRVVLTCGRPAGPRDDAFAWLEDELARVASAAGGCTVSIAELEIARHWIPPAPLLVEFEFEVERDAARLLESTEFGDLIGDLRSLRLDPRVAQAAASDLIRPRASP